MSLLFILAETSYWATFFGRFHPLLVHLPIGMLLIAFVLELLSKRQQTAVFQPAVVPVLFWSMISAWASCGAGYLLSLSGDYSPELLEEHQYQGLGLAAISTVLWIFKKYDFFGKAYQLLMYGQMVLLAIAGHHGGSLTHGSDYLTAYTPEPFRNWLGMKPIEKQEATVAGVAKVVNQESLAYSEVIEPIFRQKCMQCHNQDKQKGGLRMDTPAFLAKGGENGAIFLAGKVEGSKMCEYPTLPLEDDDHMPPKGKPQLTQDEITLIHWWVTEGASFDKKVSQLKQPDNVKTILGGKSTEAATQSVEKIKDIPDGKGDEADKKAIEKIQKSGVAVLPVAPESNWLMVNFVNGKDLNDSQVKELLSGINEQLIWAKMGETKLTDAGLDAVAQCKNLTKLSLNQTAITDAGLSKLQNLENLVYLNLYGTKVTDKGILALAKLKNLRTLYLWQTAVTTQGAEALKKQLPKVEVILGGFELKPLATDTIIEKMKPAK
jgi:uncharacterized membrane protein